MCASAKAAPEIESNDLQTIKHHQMPGSVSSRPCITAAVGAKAFEAECHVEWRNTQIAGEVVHQAVVMRCEEGAAPADRTMDRKSHECNQFRQECDLLRN
jgi:hypothetical protein